MIKQNKLLIKFFEWLYFSSEYDKGTKIVKIKGINVFLCDTTFGREHISPVWDKNRFKFMFRRMFRIKEEEEDKNYYDCF